MSAKSDALSAARLLLRASRSDDGGVDGAKALSFVKRIGAAKPRNFLLILETFRRLLRLELESSLAKVESAVEVDAETRKGLEADLMKRYGRDLQFHYAVNPDLLGGLRVRIGSDVWDGTVKARLSELSLALS